MSDVEPGKISWRTMGNIGRNSLRLLQEIPGWSLGGNPLNKTFLRKRKLRSIPGKNCWISGEILKPYMDATYNFWRKPRKTKKHSGETSGEKVFFPVWEKNPSLILWAKARKKILTWDNLRRNPGKYLGQFLEGILGEILRRTSRIFLRKLVEKNH